MNIYDTKIITCTNCKKTIGEVDYDVKIHHIMCGQCVSQLSGNKITYNQDQNKSLTKILQAV